jgi:serine/threonine-protein kinase
MYEMVTGHVAFPGDSALSAMSAILRDQVQPIGQLAPRTPEALVQIIDRCLQKKADARWQTMEEVRTGIENLKQQYDTIRISGRPTGRRAKVLVAAVAAGSAFVMAAVGWQFIVRKKTALPPPIVVVAPAPAAPVLPAPEPAATTPSTPAADAPLTNDAIVQMAEAKVPDAVVVGHIRSSKTKFDLSTAEVIRLSKAGVSAGVIQAMRDPAGTAPPPKTVAKNVPPKNAAAPVQPSPSAIVPPAPLPAATIPTSPPPVNPAPGVAPTAVAVGIADGSPFAIQLAQDVQRDAQPGTPLKFTVAKDLTVAGTVVLPKGATVLGEVSGASRRRALLIGVKMTFRLTEAMAAGGKRLKVRATPEKGEESKRPVETGAKKPKEVAATAGTEYVAYVDGDQTVTVRK